MIRSSEGRYAIVAAVATWIVLVATAPGIPIVWDEGGYLQRADGIVSWTRLLFSPGSSNGGLNAFSQDAIRQHWDFITSSEGHPAWFAIPIALTKGLLDTRLDPLTAARLGPITVFSLACGAVAWRLRREHGAPAAVVAVVALVTCPRMFAEAHFAALDGQLTAWWLMLWASDSPHPSLGNQIRSGVLLGLTTATKFTGWFAWVPVALSRLARTTHRSALLVIASIALVTFVVVNPPLWHHPIDGLTTQVHHSLDRANTLNIKTTFLGRTYDLNDPLPWYNTLVWLAFVTPPSLLVLGTIGLVESLRTRTTQSLQLVLHWATLMIVRALPQAPPHDGIRLFLPAFGFWCVLAGVGAERLWRLGAGATARTLAVRAAVVIALLANAGGVVRYFPQTLSYYSLAVGGVRGASALGMEPTYWWDALDRDVLIWINENTETGSAVAFSSPTNLDQLHAWNRLKPPTVDRDHGVFKWYVLQNRTGMLTPTDRALMAQATPAYIKYAGRRRFGDPVPRDLDVPLLLIYSYEQYHGVIRSR